MKVLYITSFLPKKNASQAGVNITYNIIDILHKSFNTDIDIMCTLNDEEYNSEDDDIRKITKNQYYFPVSKCRKIRNVLTALHMPVIASVRYDSRIRDAIKMKAKSEHYDYAFIDYTQNIAYVNILKETMPNCKIAILEHDVSFLGMERKVENTSGLKKLIAKFEYQRLKKYEINSLLKFDKVYTLNEKDKNLIENQENIDIITPFIGKWDVNKKDHDNFNIMYWGAMNRKENEDAVINFIENIWPNIDKENIKFYIIGSKPSEKIKKLQSENIIVTGFVEDPSEIFSIMDLSVVPLTLGAGIKIKVLESLANGVPVVTTSIGAEGIEYSDELIVEDDALKFAKEVNKIKADRKLRDKMIHDGKLLIEKNFGFKGNETVLRRFIQD